MSEDKEALAGFLLKLRTSGITDHRILTAFEEVPRRNFVPVIHITEAYAGGQLPIECGQTMPSATLVAKVVSALDVQDGHRVLELGTGTGYQTAILAKLGGKIVTLERFRTLHQKAGNRLSNLGLDNVILKLDDGRTPNTDFGMHDRIVSNCSFDDVPRGFLDNLASNGVMIAPIGPPDSPQILKKFTKIGSRFEAVDLFHVRMQPFIPGISRAI